MRSRKQDDFKPFQYCLDQAVWRGREIGDMASSVVDAFGLIGQHDAGDLGAGRDGNLERPTAPCGGDRRGEQVSCSVVEIAGRKHEHRAFAGSLATHARIQHDPHKIASRRGIT
jgi:hypothetical protein